MGAVWLWDLPGVISRAGLVVATYPGWESRARSTGGYDDVRAVQVHHTASITSPANDMAYIWSNAADRPIGALYLARDGLVTVGAAGATNTSGKGGPLSTSRGTIPLDAANRYVISIEAANAGTGEAWPAAQVNAYRRLVRALCDAYGLRIARGDVHSHWEWTTRKLDPAGTSPYAWGAGKWNMDAFRADVAALGTTPSPGPQPPATPIPGVNDMFYPINPFRNSDTRAFGGDGVAAGTYRFGLNDVVFPADVAAIAMTVTAVGARAAGFVTVWPDGQPLPDTSVVNPTADGAAANGAIVVGVNGLAGFNIRPNTPCHLICDISGYWSR